MIILDTSVWIEFLKGNPQFYTEIKSLLENKKIIGVEWIFGELLQGAKNKSEIKIIKAYWENIPKINTGNILIEAGIYSSIHKLTSKGVGLIDVAIIVIAQKVGAKIWSLDKKLNGVLKEKEKFK